MANTECYCENRVQGAEDSRGQVFNEPRTQEAQDPGTKRVTIIINIKRRPLKNVQFCSSSRKAKI